MYDLGLIGGMGPLASAEIYKKIIEKTKVEKDQDHINLVIISKPSINDRTAAILKEGPSPVKQINEAIEDLVKLNVKNFFIGCNSAHYFKNEFEIPKSINFLNMIDETLKYLKDHNKDKEIVILGTKGTILGNVYKNSSYSKDLNINYPNEQEQTIIMNFIYGIKAKINDKKLLKDLNKVFNSLLKRYNNPVFVLACTELSTYSNYLSNKYNVVDSVNIIVDVAIKKSGYQTTNEVKWWRKSI